MDGNTFSSLLSLMSSGQSENSNNESRGIGIGAAEIRMRLGTVTQNEPLKIRVAGVELPTNVFKINERLVKGARFTVDISSGNSIFGALSGELNGPISCPGGLGSPQLSSVTSGRLSSASTNIYAATATQTAIDLAVGDEVLLLTSDDQMFYVLMKVVDAI